jgi:hypothetical protein
MQVKTNVKAGGINMNHNQTLVRDSAKGLRVRTNLKAGGALNHNQTLVRDSAKGLRVSARAHRCRLPCAGKAEKEAMTLPTFVYRWSAYWQELWAERAAIMEFEGGMTREQAEKKAEEDIRWQAQGDKRPVQEEMKLK